MEEYDQDESAFRFWGEWSEFLPIALTNALLTMVTLGFYRFWAIARERKYLWSKTQFHDDRLEWTGTGLELFLGAVMAFFLLGVPLLVLNFILQGLLLQGQAVFAGVVGVLLYVVLLYLGGFAIFRGLRYRLSRTNWHGIRGGTDDPGFGYGLSYLWRMVVGFIPLGLMIPWASAALWKERFEAMSFGPHHFRSNPRWQILMKRFLLFYIGPTMLFIGGGYAAFQSGGNAAAGGFAAVAVIGLLMFYVMLPAIALVYYALYAREMVGTLEWDTLEFRFRARSIDWLVLFLGNAGIMLLALLVGMIALSIFGGGLGALGLLAGGPGALEGGTFAPAALLGSIFVMFLCFAVPIMLVGPFIRFRNWAFYIRNVEADGQVDVYRLTQSSTADVKQGEGLLDAMDMGAI